MAKTLTIIPGLAPHNMRRIKALHPVPAPPLEPERDTLLEQVRRILVRPGVKDPAVAEAALTAFKCAIDGRTTLSPRLRLELLAHQKKWAAADRNEMIFDTVVKHARAGLKFTISETAKDSAFAATAKDFPDVKIKTIVETYYKEKIRREKAAGAPDDVREFKR